MLQNNNNKNEILTQEETLRYIWHSNVKIAPLVKLINSICARIRSMNVQRANSHTHGYMQIKRGTGYDKNMIMYKDPHSLTPASRNFLDFAIGEEFNYSVCTQSGNDNWKLIHKISPKFRKIIKGHKLSKDNKITRIACFCKSGF